VETAQQALPLLSSPILAGVFITDSRITEKKNEALLVELVAYAKAGGIVVMWGTFSASTSRPGMDAFFRKGWDLPWKMSSYHRTTFSLNRQNELATSNHKLQDSYSMKAVHLRDVPNEAALYLNASENLAETPVVFAEIGKGRLGYVGDVNSEVGSTKTVVAMFGLEPKPVLEATFGPTQ
jgi:hypothetical protein